MHERARRGHRGWLGLALVAGALASACSGSRPASERGSGGGASGGAASGGGVSGGGASGSGGAGGALAVVTPPDATFTDGTRLVARTYAYPGTAPLFVGIYDRQEKVDCEYRLTTDGKLRCVPAKTVGTVDPATVPPLERWQEGTEQPRRGSAGRLRQNQVVAADGSAFPSYVSGELFDDTTDEPCRPDTTRELDGTGTGACLPRHAANHGIIFADAQCTSPLAVAETPGPIPLLIATPAREVFALGDRFEGQTFIKLGPPATAACVDFPSNGSTYYRVGAALPVDTVAALRVVPVGSGRLRLRTVAIQNTGVTHVRHRMLSLPSGGEGPYYDGDRGALCRPSRTTTGEVRCVPDSGDYLVEGALTNFADPQCTQPLTFLKVSAHVLMRSNAATGRYEVIEVRTVGDTMTPTAYSRMGGTECREYLKGAGYPIGDVIPLETFARLDVRAVE